ncbi:MAG TPA: apolipoprotein N-acyltransferase [bacterium]|nr:apolipoprotein N-acyltransferase [bacterium]
MFLAILSGFLLILIFPTMIFGYHFPDLGILAWIALVPLFIAIKDKKPKNAFGLGLLAGLISFLGILYWIAIPASLIGLFILASYLALYIALFCFLFNFISYRLPITGHRLLIILAPILWVSLEYLRSIFLSGFPWALLGYSQYLNTPLIQISEFTGVYGVSFLIVLANVTIAHLITDHRLPITVRRKILPVIIVAIILGACFTYGKLILRKAHLIPRNSELKVGIVQGNIGREKWNEVFHQEALDIHIRLTEEVAKEEPELIVWSETATTSCLKQGGGDLVRLSDLARKLRSHLLIGSLDLAPEDNYYNSAFLLSPKGNILYQYNKIHLVPFGEFTPLRKELPCLARLVERMGGGGFRAGEELTIFDLDGKRFGVLICYEGVFDNLARKFVKNGADFLINITNDAWFEKTSGPYQHFSFSIFRAVENRVPVVRAANTGVSGFIDSYGRIRKDLDIFIEGTLVDKIGLKRQKTFYTRFGNLFAYFCLALSGLFLAGALIKPE